MRTTILPVAGLLYFGAMWVGAAKLGGGRIFAATRAADQREFGEMTAALAGASGRACGGDVGRLLFENRDVTMPYLGLADDRIGGCMAVHETGVTPFGQAPLAGCDYALVSAWSPPYGADADKRMLIVERWRSASGRYGFVIYRGSCGAGR